MSDEIFDSIVKTVDGNSVYTYKYAEKINEDNLKKLKSGGQIKNFIPQAGFQENVLTNNADVLVIGGMRGGGKSLIMLMVPLYNVKNPLYRCHAFRKEEGDLIRGLWNTSEKIYTKFASPTALKWTYPSQATLLMEHLQNEANVDRRVRGAEMPCILIDELPQITHKTFFTLLASNRNTIGVKNKFVASCNPVSNKNWVYKLLEWYIDDETHQIRHERSGKIRYFFKWGDNISDIVWGNSPGEVYQGAKGYIDNLVDVENGESYESLITSFSFIEGSFSENKILRELDPSYKSKVATGGGAQALKDINGIWGADQQAESQITAEEIENLWFNNTEQEGKVLKCTIDVALARDFFVMYAWRGRHLFDFEYFSGVLSTDAVGFVKRFLDKHSIREENMAYDYNGIGLYLEGNFPKARPFNNKSSSSNPKMWDCLKSECADKFITNIRKGLYSVSKSVLDKNIIIDTTKSWSREKRKGIYSVTWRDRMLTESQALQRKEVDNGRWELITKATMKEIIGHSPDIAEAAMILESLPDTNRHFGNIGML